MWKMRKSFEAALKVGSGDGKCNARNNFEAVNSRNSMYIMLRL